MNNPFINIKIYTFELKKGKYLADSFYFYIEQTFKKFNNYMFNVSKNDDIIMFY